MDRGRRRIVAPRHRWCERRRRRLCSCQRRCERRGGAHRPRPYWQSVGDDRSGRDAVANADSSADTDTDACTASAPADTRSDAMSLQPDDEQPGGAGRRRIEHRGGAGRQWLRMDGGVECVVDHDYARRIGFGERVRQLHSRSEHRGGSHWHADDRRRDAHGDAGRSARAAAVCVHHFSDEPVGRRERSERHGRRDGE